MSSTAIEQYMLELINDARLDPIGDAARYIKGYTPLTSGQADIQNAFDYFGVDGSLLKKQFAALKAAQPLAWNDELAAAARGHNATMIRTDTQAHEGIGDGDPFSRMQAQGYSFSSAGENIFAYADDALEAQAGFMVDWGGSASSGGMQPEHGHRANIMMTGYREVGVGITPESNPNTAVGPLVVTEDFGTRQDSPAVLILGVAYTDRNGDGFYSVGEGRKGLTVSVAGQKAVSSSSGGYTLASDATGREAIVLSGGGLKAAVHATVNLTAGTNAKLDVIDGHILHTSVSATVLGPISTLVGLGSKGLTLKTGSGAQTLVGTKGNDTLAAGLGKDTLSGLKGKDVFLFNTAPSSTNVDTIQDFGIGADTIKLDHTVFKALKSGGLASLTYIGHVAHDAGHHILYNDTTGALSYDADGSKAGKPIEFAVLSNHHHLVAHDFLVV